MHHSPFILLVLIAAIGRRGFVAASRKSFHTVADGDDDSDGDNSETERLEGKAVGRF